jgi:hypothetical protein
VGGGRLDQNREDSQTGYRSLRYWWSVYMRAAKVFDEHTREALHAAAYSLDDPSLSFGTMLMARWAVRRIAIFFPEQMLWYISTRDYRWTAVVHEKGVARVFAGTPHAGRWESLKARVLKA